MENKNTLGSTYIDGVTAASVDDASFNQAPPPPVSDTTNQPRKKFLFKTMPILALLVLALAAAAIWLAWPRQDPNPQFNNSQLDLSNITKNSGLVNAELTILGQLSVDGGIAITPTEQPTSPKPGQLYYDQATNLLNYFNGSEFVALSSDLQIGDGLAQTDGTLTNIGVLSVQGANGDITFTAGAGIIITGTTISATDADDGTGVTSLNGLEGVLAIANATSAGSTITLDDASTSTKGIASFNVTNFTVTSGAVDTVQNINTASSPTFNGLTLSGGNLSSTNGLTLASGGTGNITLNSDSTIELLDNTNVTGTLTTTSTLTLGAVGSADTAVYLCRNSSNQLATCNTAGAGAAFVNGGNSFGGTATLGTNDSNGLNFEVGGTTVTAYGTDGSVTFQNSTDSATAFRVLNQAGTKTLLGIDALNSIITIGDTSQNATLDVGQGTNSSFFRRTTGQYLELRTNASGNSLFGFSDSGNSKHLVLGSDVNSMGIQFYTNATTSTNGTLLLTIDSATGNILVGSSNTTGTLLVLDTKTNSGDPTGVDGGMYYNSNLGRFRCYEDGVWLNCIGNAGEINMFGGSTAPAGWLLCDGSAVSRTTYSALFSVIGTAYGAGDGSTTFNLPDFRGRQATGRNSGDASYNTLGETGGEKSHTLTTSELPSHTHSFSATTGSGGSHSHNIGRDFDGQFNGGGGVYTVHDAGVSGAGGTSPTSSAGSHSHSVSGTTGSAGSGSAHNVLDPYLVVNYIIKY